MQEKLRKIFFKRFWIALTGGLFGIAILVVVSVITLVNYLKTYEKIYLPLIFFAFFIGMIIGTLISIRPFIKDWKAVKTNNFEKLTGSVIRFRKVEHGGEPPDTSYYPIIAEAETGKEIELKIDSLHLGETYSFYYLKYTKLAIIIE